MKINPPVRRETLCCEYRAKNRKMPSHLNRYRRQANSGDKKATLVLGLGLMPGI